MRANHNHSDPSGSARRMDAVATPRFAIVLHGRLGGLQSLRAGAAPQPLRSLDGAVASVSSAAMCAASLLRHVVLPNRNRYAVDIIGHSWSPEIGAALDQLYGVRRSAHEVGVPMQGFRCPDAGFAPVYCHRTVSHLLGITRAMRLKRIEESSRGFRYDAVLLSRWDVLWQQPLLDLSGLQGWHPHDPERRRRSVWLPRICAPVELGAEPKSEAVRLSERAGAAFRGSFCGGGASPWLASQSARECSRAARACQTDMTAEARELYVMDWWLLLGSSADADEFAEGVSFRFSQHGASVLARLSERKRGAVAMGHAWFGAQLLWTMNATLRHVGNIGIDFHLGRAWAEIDCLAMRPSCAAKTCRASDLISSSPQLGTPWHWHENVPTARWPHHRNSSAFPPPVSFPDPSSQMASSCEQRYFICKRHSRMCYAADGASPHPMDRLSKKALFLGCAEGLCAKPRAKGSSLATAEAASADGMRPQANSTACARLMLSLWLRVRASNSASLFHGLTGSHAEGANAAHSSSQDPSWRRSAEAIRRYGVAADEVLTARALGGLPGPLAAAFRSGQRLDAVCRDAWQRSNGGERMPIFRNLSAT